MRATIEKRLKEIVGLKWSARTRTLNLECLQFGQLTKTSNGETGEHAIHINCDWRIVGGMLYIGSKDIDFRSDGTFSKDVDLDFDTFRDVELNELLKRNELIVESVLVDDYGGFEIEFEKKIRLQVIPMTSSKDWTNEYWRIFMPSREDAGHLVITSRGIQ